MDKKISKHQKDHLTHLKIHKDFLKSAYNITQEQLQKAGTKDDKTKPLVMRGFLQQFPRAVEEVARVSEFGAEKYTWNGWETVPDGIERYGEALVRHMLRQGHDPESGMLHAVHAAWNAMARLELMLRGK